MATDYLSFFNLSDDPFHLTPDTAYFYNSPEHATALLSLEYCISEKVGFCILTGEPGTGKTTILRLFTEKWKERAEIALVMTPRLSADEFFLAILDDFKIPLSSSKNEMLKAFRAFLLTHAADGKRVAIIVDEAQELPESTLEELRLLSNMETEKEKLLQIILIGQPELRSKLLSEQLRQLNQRITVRVQLKPLTEPETSDYINTRLIKGGISSMLYNQKAKNLIFNLSGGIPRTINLLASRALMCAFLDGNKIVSEKHVQIAAQDVMEPLASNSNKKTMVEQRSISAPTESSVLGTSQSPLRKLATFARGLTQSATAGIKRTFFGRGSPELHSSETSPDLADSDEDWVLPTPGNMTKPAVPAADDRTMSLLELEVGSGLAPMPTDDQGGDLCRRIRFIRDQISRQFGIDVPPITINNNPQLKEYEYNLMLRGAWVGGSELTSRYLAMDSGAASNSITGMPAQEPIFGLPAFWIEHDDREQAQNYGYTVVDNNTVVATHISELIKRHAQELVGRQEIEQLLDTVSETTPAVVKKLIPNLLDLDTVEQVIKNILKDGGSIRDMRAILECLTTYAALTKDPDKLTEYVRLE